MVNSSLLHNTNTALYTDKTGCSSKVGMKQLYKGGGYGATMQSMKADAEAGFGHLKPSRVPYSNCNQKGGNKLGSNLGLGHPSLAETRFNHESAASYGYTAGGAADAQNFKGSYHPVTKNESGQQCGGRRKTKRKTVRKKRRKTVRKTVRKKRRNKRHNKSICKCSGKCKCGKKCKCLSKRGSKRSKRSKRGKRSRRSKRGRRSRRSNRSKRSNRGSRRRGQRGGSSIFYSSFNNELKNDAARLLGRDQVVNTNNCGDNYNHFSKSKSDVPTLY
jgi:hypothetical protein